MHIAHSNYAFQVSKERGEGIAREHNISFLETSAKVMPYINPRVLRQFLLCPCRQTSTSRRLSLSLQRPSWTRAMCKRQNQCRSLWTSLPSGGAVLGALSSLLINKGCRYCFKTTTSLKRPWLKDVLIICVDFKTVFTFCCFSLKICLSAGAWITSGLHLPLVPGPPYGCVFDR